MKRLLITLFIVLNTVSFSKYDYPFKNPNVATIFGSSKLMMEGVSEEVPVEELSIDLPWAKEVPAGYWYNKGFRYSLSAQEKRSPLIFLLAGTGAAHNSVRNEIFQRILYDAGFSVVSISSPMNQNFILNGSSTRMPGMIFEDSKDVYAIMKEIYKAIKHKVDVSEFYLTGYSLGATESGMIAYLDDKEKAFDFKRVFMVNPAVDSYKSATKLDKFLDFPEEERAQKLGELIDNILDLIVKGSINDYTVIDPETIFAIFSKSSLTNKEMQELIGGAFRLSAVDLNYMCDSINGTNVYKTTEAGKFTPMFENFKKVNFASFEDYVNKVAYPYFKQNSDGEVTMEELLEKSKLQYIDSYLKKSKKIAVVTNADELILDDKDIDYLEKTFKNRIIVYPYGGHCGNMFYWENIKNMISFLKEGKFADEKK